MPLYHIVHKRAGEPDEPIQGYESPFAGTLQEIARDWNQRQKRMQLQGRYVIVQICDDDSWTKREQARFASGQYLPVPWANEPWADPLHYAHVSKDDPTMVAYTPDESYGQRDRKMRCRPARYLARHTSLGDAEARKWTTKFHEIYKSGLEVHFARTADEIEEVYLNGPESCMSHDESDYDSPFHPVRVYAGPDLAVAYIKRDDRITARALCWPVKKLYSRVYGDSDRFEPGLEELGYTQGRLDGARFARYRYEDCFVVPYIDTSLKARDDGKHLVISSNGNIDCANTNGLSSSGWVCPRCDETSDEEDSCWIEDQGERWCQSCTDDYTFYCDGCHELYSGSPEIVTAGGSNLCDGCARKHSQCEHCSEYYPDEIMSEDCNSDNICDSCASDMEHCETCGLSKPDGSTCCEERPNGRIEDERQEELQI